MSDFLLPDLGEGLTEATIVAWHVEVGDEVTRNQALAEVETAKALVELPSPRAGRISALHAEEGQTLDVGAPLVGFAEVGAAAADGGPADAPAAAPGDTAAAPDGAAAAPDRPATEARPQRQQVLVGYGPVLPGSGRPRRRARTFPTTPYVRPEPAAGAATTRTAARERPRAMPPVRRRARDLGVDLTAVHGSGPGGRILREDVEACAPGGKDGPVGHPVGDGPGSRRVPVTGLRKQTAKAMTASASTAPHASVHVTCDVTDTLALLERGGRDRRRTSFLAAVCRALVPAAARTPAANARYDAGAGQIELFDRVRVGIAVATERGLLVATLPEADHADGPALTAAIAATAQRAREGDLSPGEVTGSTLTVTNVGVFGVDGGTPILNPGQSVILAIGALRTQPWEHRGEIALRTVVTLTLSFDHRVLDGAEASAFLMDIAETLADPASLLVR
jgi:pyruvate dehydrogenase E2 component (dihydrolipoamide acetyltransferase)